VHVILLLVNVGVTVALSAQYWAWRDELPRWNVRLLVGMIAANLVAIALNAVYLGGLALGVR